MNLEIPDDSVGWVVVYESPEGYLSGFSSERRGGPPPTGELIDATRRMAASMKEIRDYKNAR